MQNIKIDERVNLVKKPVVIASHMKEFVNGALFAFGIKIVGAVCAFVLNVLIARKFGAETAGLYFIAVTVVTVASVVGRVGLDNAFVRHTSAYAATGDWARVKGLCSSGLSLSVLVSTLLAGVLYWSSSWQANVVFAKPGLGDLLRIFAFSVVPLCVFLLYSQLLRGLRKTVPSEMIQGVALSAILAIALLVSGDITVDTAALYYVVGAWCVAIASFAVWTRAIRPVRKVKVVSCLKLLCQSAPPLYVVSVASMAMQFSALLFLGAWANASEVAVYQAANRTAMFIGFITLAGNSILAPKFSEFHVLTEMSTLELVAKRATNLMMAAALPLVFLLVALPEHVLALFGRGFSQGALLLQIMAFANFVHVSTAAAGHILMMTGHESLVRNVIVACGIAQLVLCLVLIPMYSGLGAALAVALGLVFSNLAFAFVVYRKMGFFVFDPFGLSKQLRKRIFPAVER